ncbi:16S rRNA (uracil(1498)-N(3))-methyltransferase [Lentilactobacillus otakiensis]|uniref:Ribosomal RNA small subunit methyltransferase E n=1 Tax=Lentilactobacillus otakiensis DSM 19908 = JCM 15040 TaxID=1423780 RepID=S4PNH2_9LACO|nr:16S rRNA (uracil(1498)-N(3))-methyltransferase [Lentilactobacillus otakiensis]KRL09113.1 ribosomal RNA small subunit methyltransferase E [Lentilactobacillus otakiensis DSM 19908 = JCM 15040]MBZ3775728.1 16S rRNA (uracil(1498)-N(3))-methyltransferase [Lentilactobacillus otakiensis]MDV3518947.1 16S rRNA (uracil(1498)-N(3))-methyltransferase [Lentilactobacillus otakiensis]GAD15890.1 RNA methyltransferase [Lentilactobacillus otakiensis DSM 19908 = JCM 15040]
MQHYFLDQALKTGESVTLPSNIGHHLGKVLRAEVGDHFELVAPDHQVFEAQVSALDGNIVKAKILTPTNKDVELPVNVTIVSGLSKGNKPEWIVQKATELGVAHIIFMPMNWSVVKWNQKAAKKIARLNEVALSAAEQSHRNIVPTVEYLDGLKALTQLDFDTKLVAYEESAKQGEEANLVKAVKQTAKGGSIVAVFGPEGGVSESEIEDLKAHGFILAGLGPRIMRTETAPLYFLSAISVLTELSAFAE